MDEMLALLAELQSKLDMTVITPTQFGPSRAYERVSFHRTELSVILAVYGRMVAAGEWKDYSIDFLRERAVFSVFRRATEHPLYRIEKRPKDAQKQGAYSVLGHDGQILKRGRDLKTVMRVFDKKLIRVVN